MVRTTGSWLDSFGHVAAATGLTGQSRMWLPGPLAATMNLFAATLARWLGAHMVDRPQEATHTHLTPLHLDRLLDEQAAPQGLHVTVAGDRLSSRLHGRAVAAGATVSHYYGAAELSFVGWGAHEDDLRLFPQVEVEVRDGEIWARSPYLCQGYAGTPGVLRTDGRGFATIGDRGTLHEGVLTVSGRGGGSVTTGGATVLVADVESVLRTVTRGEVVVVGLPHETLGQVVAAFLTDASDFDRALAGAREMLAPTHRPRVWLHLAELPVTQAGKIDRTELSHSLWRTDSEPGSEPGPEHGAGPRVVRLMAGR